MALGETKGLRLLLDYYTRLKAEGRKVPTTSYSTIQDWSWKYNWFERAAEEDARKDAIKANIQYEKDKAAIEARIEKMANKNLQISDLAYVTIVRAMKLIDKAIKEHENTPLNVNDTVKLMHATAKYLEVAQATENNVIGLKELIAHFDNQEE